MFGGDAGKERLMCVVEEVEGWRGWMYRGGWRWMAMMYIELGWTGRLLLDRVEGHGLHLC